MYYVKVTGAWRGVFFFSFPLLPVPRAAVSLGEEKTGKGHQQKKKRRACPIFLWDLMRPGRVVDDKKEIPICNAGPAPDLRSLSSKGKQRSATVSSRQTDNQTKNKKKHHLPPDNAAQSSKRLHGFCPSPSRKGKKGCEHRWNVIRDFPVVGFSSGCFFSLVAYVAAISHPQRMHAIVFHEPVSASAGRLPCKRDRALPC